MTEFPLLCINPGCRPQDHGGPRRTERAWFCPVCTDHARQDLHSIADSWDDLQEALTSWGSNDLGERVNGSKAPGLNVNEAAVHARTKATALVWFLVRELLDRCDVEARTPIVPADQTTPSIARWLAKWHISGWATHPSDEFAVEVFVDIRNARRDVRKAAYPSGARKVETGLPCDQHGTSEAGERIPCHGSMFAWVSPQMPTLPDLICDADSMHRLDPATWQRAGWKRAHAAGMDGEAMSRLANVITT